MFGDRRRAVRVVEKERQRRHIRKTRGKQVADKNNKNDEKWFYSFVPNGISGGATSTLIPIFAAETLGGNVAQVGLISSASSAASVPSSVLWGNLSDKLKLRKCFVLIGFAGMSLSLLLMALSLTIEQYFLFNLLMGVLATASAPVGVVLVVESARGERVAEKIGIFSKVGGWGWVFGLVLGAIWLHFIILQVPPSESLRSLFVLGSLLSVLSLFLALRWIEEPRFKRRSVEGLVRVHSAHLRVHERGSFLPSRLHYLRFAHIRKKKRRKPLGKDLQTYFVATLFIFAGFITFYAVFPVFLIDEGRMNVSEVFIIYLASSATAALTYSPAGRWIDRFGNRRLQSVAIGVRIFLFPFFALVPLAVKSHVGILVVFLLMHVVAGLCWGIISIAGNVTVCEFSSPENRGFALGTYSAVIGIGSIVGGMVSGIVANYCGFLAAFVISGVLIASGLLIFSRTGVSE